jgi:uncharacterized protein
MKIIDVHTHAFPDNVAGKAIANLAKQTGPYQPFTDGTIKGLLSSMDEAGIASAFVLNVATKPDQAKAIKAWSAEIASDRIIPVGSIHPASANWREEIVDFRTAGIKGIKFHPMYQGFAVDDARMFPVYETIAAAGMFAIFHAGNDIVFPGNRQSSADKFAIVLKNIPRLKFILAHFGGWQDWEAFYENICGSDVFIETSFLHEVPESLRDKIFLSHDRNRFLFGSDSPWGNQKAQVDFINNLKTVSDDFKEGVFHRNTNYLLNFH